nr:serine/threonine-protein phosphatase 6 regulatory ankyrin repeat subunit B-like [Aedes albopictus]
MKAAMFDPATALDYVSGENAGAHGNIYQRDLAFMLFVRVALKGYKFKLFTELPEAGKFDDVVLYVEDFNETWLFQAKHMDPSKPRDILAIELIPRKLFGNDFDLFKYARSYLQVARRIKGNKRYFLFTNKSLDEESIRNSEHLEIFPGKVDEMIDLSPLGGEYKMFQLKSDKSDMLVCDANKDFYSLLDAIRNILSTGVVDKSNKILWDYKTVVRKMLVKESNQFKLCEEFLLADNESPAMNKMKEKLKCVTQAAKTCENDAGLLNASNSRNTELPDYIGETELEEFFKNFTMCVKQPNDLRNAVENELLLWVRKNVPPDSLGQFTSSQLDQPMAKFYQTFKEWYEPNMEGSKSKIKLFLGSEKAEKCTEAILEDFEHHILQPDVLKRYYVPREIDCGNLSSISDEVFLEWLMQEFASNNCVVLIAGPGMGKTTFMQYVSFAMQRAYHSTTFYMIYLNRLNEKLQEQEMANGRIDLEQTLRVFRESLSEQSCTVIREHKHNKNSRIVFFLDGFDEVVSAENSKMIAIFKQLLSIERTQLMISGRKHVQQTLQQYLPKFRNVSLVPFANRDQLDFLQMFWNVSKEDERTLAKFWKFANLLLETFHRGIKRSQYDFTGVPLMVRMLAEVYEGNFEKFLQADDETNCEKYLPTEGFSEVTLYQQFVMKSFCMKLLKKFHLDPYTRKPSFDEEFRVMFDQTTLEHQLAAINELNIKELVDVVSEHGNKYEVFLNRVRNGDEKSLLINTIGTTVRFVHLSFGEYFVANYLCDNVERCKHVLLPILEKQSVVRKFFFRLIEETSGDVYTKCLAALHQICELNPKVAFWACEAVCVNVTKCLLNHNALQNIRIKRYGTILHVAISIGSREIVEYLLENHGMDSNIISNTEIHPVADFLSNKQHYVKSMSIDNQLTPLIWAAYLGRANIVNLLLSHSADVNAKPYCELTALHVVAQYGFLEIADVLIQTNKLNGNARDEYGRTALHYAIHFDQMLIVQLLMKHSKDLALDLNAVDNDENSALHFALIRNCTEVAELLIEEPSVEVNARNNVNEVPLHLAVKHGNTAIVELLLSRKASIDVLNWKNFTPLKIAAASGQTNIVKMLIANGANIKTTGMETLALAALSGKLELCKYLLELMNYAQIPEEVLWKAIKSHNVEVIKLFIKYCVEVNDARRLVQIPQNALRSAIRSGNVEVIKLLVRYRFDVIDARISGCTTLHVSVLSANIDIVRTLLDHGAVVDSKDENEETPLMVACCSGHVAIAKILLEKSANPNAQDIHQWTPLHFASYSGHLAVVQLLLDVGAEVNATESKQRTPLHWAATRGREDIVKLLLSRSANQNLQDSDQNTPFHLAIFRQLIDGIAELFINERTDLTLRNKKGWTPLHAVVHYEPKISMPQLILPETLNVPDCNGCTPLHLAVDSQSVENVETLLNHSPDPNVQNNNHQTPLHLAAQHGNMEIVRQLLVVPTTIIDILDKGLNTPLHLALQHVHAEIAELLIGRSSELEAKNRTSQTPLHLASNAGLGPVVRVLIQRGVHVNPRDVMQRTPLHLAAHQGHVNVVQVLIENSAQVDATDRQGRTPLQLAIKRKKDGVVTMIQNYM